MRDIPLSAKLHIPAGRARSVSRPRLVARLNDPASALTLISAPAGAGQTTLLGEWASQAGGPNAWLSLDDGDNDPARFWAYVVAALQRLKPDIGAQALAMLGAPQPPAFESIVAALISEIAAWDEAGAVVLDDYHAITADTIHATIALFIEQLAVTRMRAVISSRSDPPLPLARLRARGQLAELRGEALRFTPTEAAAFLEQTMGLHLPPETAAELERHTEGWIAGLQLAALSMQSPNRAESTTPPFAGSHRFIADYLIEEVVRRQPFPVQAFLQQTSILERFDAPLCEAVTGQRDAQAMLEYLERSNLFLVPLDGERRWYRYHHLFAEALRVSLIREKPGESLKLHRRAGEWHASQNAPLEAIEHMLAARDFTRAADLIDPACNSLIRRGEVHTIRRWLQALPDAVTRARPGLCVWYAWVLLLDAGDAAATESYLRSAEEPLGREWQAYHRGSQNESLQTLLGQIAVVRSFVARQRGDRAATVEYARQALDLLPQSQINLRSLIAFNLGLIHWQQNDLPDAEQAFSEACRIIGREQHPYVELSVLGYLSHARLLQGRLHEAEQLCRQSLDLASAHKMPLLAGPALLQRGEILREWNQLDAAEACLRESIELNERMGDRASVDAGHLVWARIKQAQGDGAGALALIQKAERDGRSDRSAAEHARIWLGRSNLLAAERALDGGTAQEAGGARLVHHLTLARLHIARGRCREALDILKSLREPAERAGRQRILAEMLVLQALAHQAAGHPPQAIRVLERALALAEPEGYVRLFLDEGASMARLLDRLPSTHPQRSYAERLRAAFEPLVPTDGAHPPVNAFSPADPLRPREIEILQLLATGLSNREVASRLNLSVGTVRWYVKQIFRKLDVHNRTQAAHRARTLNLV
jgi:LuxR family maltose regulon positive regulatory protein